MKTFIEKYCTKAWQDFINFHKETKTFKKGQYIFEANQETKGLFIIDSGKVKITYRQLDESKRLIRLANEGDILGHRGFGGNWEYPISAFALEDTSVSFISVEIFNTVAKSNAEFTYHMMMFFAEELRKSEANTKQYPVKNQVARALLDNLKAFGYDQEDTTKLSYTLSRKDIASKAGTTYETVVRTFADLNKSGIIRIDKKAIHILNENQLRKLARPEKV